MARYLLGRAAQAVLVLWAAFTISFIVLYTLPSDPVSVMVGPDARLSPAELDAMRHEFGFDHSVVVQYFLQLGRIVQGDFGRSLQSREPVSSVIVDALPHTAQITGAGLLLGVLFGASLALTATFVRSRLLRQALLSLPPLGVAIPSFWAGLLLLQQFSFTWNVFPAFGEPGWRGLVLPALTLAMPAGAVIAQLLAQGMNSALRQSYIETARAKGVSRTRVHLGHALRNAVLPSLTMTGLLVGGLMSGAVVVETVFSRPGLGRLMGTAVTAQDLPVVQGLVLVSALVFVTVNLLVDLAYLVLDPRIGRERIAGRPPVPVTGG